VMDGAHLHAVGMLTVAVAAPARARV
jgi:hypothetical protein